MDTDFFALASFVVITTFTPGPNNISSASMGVLYGYKTSSRYLSGIAAGFFLVLLLCGWISSTLIRVFPAIENMLRIIGAIYILWLAFNVLRASYAFKVEKGTVLGFFKGFFLQLLNPKVIVYGFTLYSTFLGGVVTKPFYLIASALAFTGVGYCSISAWALFGAAIRTHLNRPAAKRVINLTLALLLVYAAVELSGMLDFLFS